MGTTQTTEALQIQVRGRSGRGKNANYRTRQDGFVPAVVYGPLLKENILVSVDPKQLVATYRKAGHTSLVSLEAVEGAPKELHGTKVLLGEIQTDPLSRRTLHVDLHQLNLKKKVRVVVPLVFAGKAKGLGEGGLMSISMRQVEIRCLPLEIPHQLEVDITDLNIGDSIHVEDLAKKMETDKLEFIYDSNFSIVAIVQPEEEKAAATTDAAAAAPAAGAAPAAAAGAKAAAPAAGAKAPAAAAKAPAAKK